MEAGRIARTYQNRNERYIWNTTTTKEALNKSGKHIMQTDFSFDCMKTTQEYLMYFKEFSCNQAENMQARCVPRFIQCFPNFRTIFFIYTAPSYTRIGTTILYA